MIWGVAFNLGRAVVQFVSMLFLVRLLTPQIYGQFALAQAIQLFLAVVSFKTIAPFALQARDPSQFDWNTHFSAGVTLNAVIMTVTLLIAGGIYTLGGEQLQTVAFVLAIMSFGFPIEVMSTHYFTWLQAHHLWQRMRTLLFFGAVLASLAAVFLAAAGGGILALAVGNFLFVLPLIADYFIRKPFPLRFRPAWFREYGEGRKYGLNRIAAGSLHTGSALAEHSVLSGVFGFSTLGIYTRAIGLAQITSGRIGPVVTQALYPVLTRAEPSSEQFRRFSGILFQGALWTTAPAAVFLGLEASNIVRVLYGEQWSDVVPLMGAAAALLALRGLHLTMNQIMLANLQQRDCLRLDLVTAVTMLTVIITAVAFGPLIYLTALGVHAALVLTGTVWVASHGGAIWGRVAAGRMMACGGALLMASSAAFAMPLDLGRSGAIIALIAEIAARGAVFSIVYVAGLRLLAPRSFSSLLDVLPLPKRVSNFIRIVTLIPRSSDSMKM